MKVAAKPVEYVYAKQVPIPMKPSKFEGCLFILQVVTQKGPMSLTTIMSEFKFNRSLLEDCLELLVKQNLIIEETGYGNNVICDITEIGNNVLEFFNVNVPTEI